MLLGLRVRAMREKQNLTPAEVVRRAGLSPSCLSRIETSHTIPTIETLIKISKALEVPMYKFFPDKSVDSFRKTASQRPTR
jgi:transcriptional regulator with XRE-family HTH domain